MFVYLCIFFFLSNNVFIGVLFLPLFHTVRSSAPVWLFVCLCLYVCLRLSVCLSVCFSDFFSSVSLVFLPNFMATFLFFPICVCLSACLSVRPSARLRVALMSIYVIYLLACQSVKRPSACIFVVFLPSLLLLILLCDRKSQTRSLECVWKIKQETTVSMTRSTWTTSF